jgi:hypothetical protein
LTTSNQSPELAARVTEATGVLSAFHEERIRAGHKVDWLALAVRLGENLSGILDLLNDAEDDSEPYPEPGVAHPGGGWISGASITAGEPK